MTLGLASMPASSAKSPKSSSASAPRRLSAIPSRKKFKVHNTMNTPTPTDKLRRALWLAFQASSPMGMGFLHSAQAAQITEATIFDYAGVDEPEPRYIGTDYLSGRMMKTGFAVDEDGK